VRPSKYWFNYASGEASFSSSLGSTVSEAIAYSRSITRWGLAPEQCWIDIHDEHGVIGKVNYYWSPVHWKRLR